MRWAVLAGLLGVGAGWLGASLWLPAAPAPDLDLPRAQAQGGPVLASPSCPDDSPLVSQLAALQAEVEAARAAQAVLDGQLAAEIGTPVFWSDAIPETFGEEAIETHLSSLVSQVEGARLAGMDCAEYPCVALVSFTGEAMAGYQAFQELHGASLYKVGWSTSGISQDDETHEVTEATWLLAFPAGIPQDEEEATSKRTRFRMDDLSKALKN